MLGMPRASVDKLCCYVACWKDVVAKLQMEVLFCINRPWMPWSLYERQLHLRLSCTEMPCELMLLELLTVPCVRWVAPPQDRDLILQVRVNHLRC